MNLTIKDFIKEHGFDQYGNPYGVSKKGQDMTAALAAFDIDDLGPFERMQYDRLIKRSDKVSVLRVLINSTEGDYSQLSDELAAIAEAENPDWMTEKKQYVEVMSKDTFELDNKLSKVDGILGVSIETVNKARVFYNDKVFKEADVLDLVAKKNKSIKESSSKMPEKGTPEWHRLQVAKKTVKMNPAMASLMGGMSMEEAEEVLKKYGVEIKEAKISKSVDVHKGKMHRLLGMDPSDEITKKYTSGKKLYDDLMRATDNDEKEVVGMLAYAANINPGDNVFDKALRHAKVNESAQGMEWSKVDSTFDVKVKDIEVYGINKFMNIGKNIDVDTTSSARVSYYIEPDIKEYGIRGIDVYIKSFSLMIEWTVYKDDLTEEDIRSLVAAGGTVYSNDVSGEIDIQCLETEWDITNDMEFTTSGALGINNVTVDLENKKIEIQ